MQVALQLNSLSTFLSKANGKGNWSRLSFVVGCCGASLLMELSRAGCPLVFSKVFVAGVDGSNWLQMTFQEEGYPWEEKKEARICPLASNDLGLCIRPCLGIPACSRFDIA